MSAFQEIEKRGHENVLFVADVSAGLRAIIAIHDVTLGPALGGFRVLPYKSEAEALRDVLRLSRGMTYKSSVAGLNLGGGKAVAIGEPKEIKKDKGKWQAFFRAFGRGVQSLGGKYITAEDSGTSVEDMEIVRQITKHVTGLSEEHGGSGDPSPVTALGVFEGLKACLAHVFDHDSFEGRSVAVQGAGHVGYYLAKHLAEAGAFLFFSEPDEKRAQVVIKEFGAQRVNLDEIYDQKVDVFSPNALGAIINDSTIPRLQCRIIAGGANNQLQDGKAHGKLLRARGIIYAPDFVINAGGVINVYGELQPGGYNRNWALEQAGTIGEKIKWILEETEKRGTVVSTHEVAEQLAMERIEEARR